MHTSLNGWYSQFPVQYSTVLEICLHSRKIYMNIWKMSVILLQELTLENIMCTKGLLLKKMVMYMSLDILNVEIKGS